MAASSTGARPAIAAEHLRLVATLIQPDESIRATVTGSGAAVIAGCDDSLLLARRRTWFGMSRGIDAARVPYVEVDRIAFDRDGWRVEVRIRPSAVERWPSWAQDGLDVRGRRRGAVDREVAELQGLVQRWVRAAVSRANRVRVGADGVFTCPRCGGRRDFDDAMAYYLARVGRTGAVSITEWLAIIDEAHTRRGSVKAATIQQAIGTDYEAAVRKLKRLQALGLIVRTGRGDRPDHFTCQPCPGPPSRGRGLRAPGEVPTRLRFDVFDRDGRVCRYCGHGPADGVKLHVDHIHPRSKGGASSLDNLVTACEDCNLGKSDRVLR